MRNGAARHSGDGRMAVAVAVPVQAAAQAGGGVTGAVLPAGAALVVDVDCQRGSHLLLSSKTPGRSAQSSP